MISSKPPVLLFLIVKLLQKGNLQLTLFSEFHLFLPIIPGTVLPWLTVLAIILEIKHTLHPLLYCNKQRSVWFRICVMQPQISQWWSLQAGCLDTRSVPSSKKFHVRYFADLNLKSQRESRLFSHFIDGKLRNRVNHRPFIMGYTQGQLHLCLLGWKQTQAKGQRAMNYENYSDYEFHGEKSIQIIHPATALWPWCCSEAAHN